MFCKNAAWMTAALVGLLISITGQVQAAIVTCPPPPNNGDRVFTLDTVPVAECLDFGTGNLSGNSDAINQMGYVTLDKSDDALSGSAPGSLTVTPPTSGLSGTFSITAPSGFFNFVIAFKSGQGQLDPDWAAFSLPAGVFSGSWSISGNQELSHANLYAQVVPLPTAIWLLSAGLVSIVAFTRRRRSSQANSVS